MKKNLNATAITNELKGGSAFFRGTKSPVPLSSTSSKQVPDALAHKAVPEPKESDTTVSRYHDTTVATVVSPTSESIEEKTRRAVKQLGKEAATYRFTVDEKKALGDIVYAYKQRGIRTSDNEITRISLNYLLEDYSRNGEKSLLAIILSLLNS